MSIKENFGKTAKDHVTGFEGKVTGVAEYIHGYTSVQLTKLKEDGTLIEEWFDANRIEMIN